MANVWKVFAVLVAFGLLISGFGCLGSAAPAADSGVNAGNANLNATAPPAAQNSTIPAEPKNASGNPADKPARPADVNNSAYGEGPLVEDAAGYSIMYYDSKHGLPRDHVNCVSEDDTIYLTFPNRVMKLQNDKFVDVDVRDMVELANAETEQTRKFFEANLSLACFVSSSRSGQWLLVNVGSLNEGVAHRQNGQVVMASPGTSFADVMFEDKAGRIWLGNIAGMRSISYYENGEWNGGNDSIAPLNNSWVDFLGYDRTADRVYLKARDDFGQTYQYWYFKNGKWTQDAAFGIEHNFDATGKDYVASDGFSRIVWYAREGFKKGRTIDISSRSGWVQQVLVDKNGDAWVTGKNSFENDDGVARVRMKP